MAAATIIIKTAKNTGPTRELLLPTRPMPIKSFSREARKDKNPLNFQKLTLINKKNFLKMRHKSQLCLALKQFVKAVASAETRQI